MVAFARLMPPALQALATSLSPLVAMVHLSLSAAWLGDASQPIESIPAKQRAKYESGHVASSVWVRFQEPHFIHTDAARGQ
jgi:hypothetical protein